MEVVAPSPESGTAAAREFGISRIAVAQKTVEPACEKSAAKVFQLSQRTNSLLGVRIVACGGYVPERVVTNADLEAQYGFEPGWIEQRTGILSRHHAAPDEATSDLCVKAARLAMRSARVEPDEIDLVVVGTFSPDFGCPSTACLVQDKLGLDAPAFDLQAACSGFMYALVTASQFVATGNSRLALVIGGDVNSRIVDPYDQRTAPLFGDGAGAVLVSRGEPHQGLICYQMGSDGSGGPMLSMPSGGTRNPATPESVRAGEHFLRMDGRNVFKWAVRALTDTVELVLEKSGMSVHDVSLFLFHQANVRIINHAVEQLGIPPEKVFNNLHRYGNTSAGSIPLAMNEAHQAGLLARGDTVLMSGFGGGLTWGTGLFRW
ncbi:MAG: beta-ketoacyl-ACP synthase III [Planctomycetaceae bacterium]